MWPRHKYPTPAGPYAQGRRSGGGGTLTVTNQTAGTFTAGTTVPLSTLASGVRVVGFALNGGGSPSPPAGWTAATLQDDGAGAIRWYWKVAAGGDTFVFASPFTGVWNEYTISGATGVDVQAGSVSTTVPATVIGAAPVIWLTVFAQTFNTGNSVGAPSSGTATACNNVGVGASSVALRSSYQSVAANATTPAVSAANATMCAGLAVK